MLNIGDPVRFSLYRDIEENNERYQEIIETLDGTIISKYSGFYLVRHRLPKEALTKGIKTPSGLTSTWTDLS